ncbi:MAG: LEA type 2 family protein [Woeseiaceae bacterium]|nr:LEA type 2 family protein [Woeseiaceae bacterium]
MNSGRRYLVIVLVALTGLGACASVPENLVTRPDVQLRDVQVLGLGFKNQTFLLSFDIHNPNPYPLPVNHISYGVRLDGLRFASGQTESDISVPAGGDAEFAISVELDLLTTAPRLLSIVREGVRRDISYELEGKLGIDIPMSPPVSYRSNGSIRLHSGGF